MVRRHEFTLNLHDLVYVDEQFRLKAASVVAYEFHRWTIVKDIGINEVLNYFCWRNIFHRQSLVHLTEQVSNYQKVFISSFCFDEFGENINTLRR